MDRGLIQKYDRRVPRYTSYPTSPHFSAAVDAVAYESWLGALPSDATGSLYIHVPFCSQLCHYCGCHTSVVHRYAPVGQYVALLEAELRLVAAAIGRPMQLRHVHWGGGTPNVLSPDDFRGVMTHVARHFSLAPNAEIAVEIDPRTLTPAMVGAFAASGVTRVSLGVQDLDPKVQATVNRIQSVEETSRAVQWLRRAGIRRLNIDLMYGLPHQTVEGVVKTARSILRLKPDRIALFGYAHVPWMKRHQKLLPEEALPDSEQRFEQAQAAAACFTGAGYVRVGLDHFARAGDTLARSLGDGSVHRNFQGYTDDVAPVLIGVGASAIGILPQGYVQNAVAVPAYAEAIRAGRLATVRGIALAAEDRLRRDIIERLMCELEVDIAAALRRHGFPSGALAGELGRLEPFMRDGLVHADDGVLSVTERGRPFVRTICAVFDRYLQPGETRHAQAV